LGGGFGPFWFLFPTLFGEKRILGLLPGLRMVPRFGRGSLPILPPGPLWVPEGKGFTVFGISGHYWGFFKLGPFCDLLFFGPGFPGV